MGLQDSQVVEIQGRNWLVNQLYTAGIEVARPERDRGVDLVAFQDRRPDGRFAAVPLQLKAFTGAGWDVSRKYERIPGLVVCHVWDLADPERTRCIAMTHTEAVEILSQFRAITTLSWTRDGYYYVEPLTKQLVEVLSPYVMDSSAWQRRLDNAAIG